MMWHHNHIVATGPLNAKEVFAVDRNWSAFYPIAEKKISRPQGNIENLLTLVIVQLVNIPLGHGIVLNELFGCLPV